MAHDDPVFLGFMEAVRKNMETGFSLGIVGFMPWLNNLLPRSWLGLDLMQERVDRVYSYFEVLKNIQMAIKDVQSLLIIL